MKDTEARRHLLHGAIGLLRELRATTKDGHDYEDKMIVHHADALLTRANKLIEDVPELKAPDTLGG